MGLEVQEDHSRLLADGDQGDGRCAGGVWQGGRRDTLILGAAVAVVTSIVVVAAALVHAGRTGTNGGGVGLDFASFVLNSSLSPHSPPFQWLSGLPNGFLVADRSGSVYRDGFGGPPVAKDLNTSVWSANHDGTKLLLALDIEPIFRHSYSARYEVLDVASQTRTPLLDGERLQDVRWAPAGDCLAFVRQDNNLWVWWGDADGLVQLTTDGSATTLNGISDWVYEEEVLETSPAFWWSPNAEQVAFLRFNISAVPSMDIPLYEGRSFPTEERLRYPVPGSAVPEVALLVAAINGSSLSSSLTRVSAPLVSTYVTSVSWVDDARVAFTTLNRLQNQGARVVVDASTGQQSLRPAALPSLDAGADGWVPVVELTGFAVLPDDRVVALMPPDSGPNGYVHLGLFESSGALACALTSSDEWGVTQLLRVTATHAYFSSTVRGPLQSNVERVPLVCPVAVDPLSVLPPALFGWNTVSFSSSGEQFLLSHSSSTDVPSTLVVDAQTGATVKVLEANDDLVRAMVALPLPRVTYERMLYFECVRYHAGNQQQVTSRNAALMYQYSGPYSQTVMDAYPWVGARGRFHAYIPQALGVDVVMCDGRGTGGRGSKWAQQTYLRLGQLESEDQIAVAKHLREAVGFGTVGIWGWSFGGYITTKVAANSAFDFAMAVAPVADWRFYDAVYTERYMRIPATNAEGYTGSSVLPTIGALPATSSGSSSSGRFLLQHGTGDDNVHFLNSAEIIKTLMDAQRTNFEMAVYPNEQHGLASRGAQVAVWTRLKDFVDKKTTERNTV